MPPETFNRVQVRAIGWQSNYPHPMLKQAQRCQRFSAFRIRCIVHHQHHSPGRVFFHQQLLQEVDKLRTVLRFRRCPGDLIAQPVVATKNVLFWLASRPSSRNAPLLANLHPARSQWRIEAQRGSVHKDELEIVLKDFFFNSSSNSSALALASLSCKCPKSYFGRRYR